ncbi:hypothetical protein M9H77_28023 [Catharanthus roseus]|uniref:Uncharacterized protein n=1 Tax=Catharanthus roseus TaxID=4058 RepID=A0ACC0AED3_CATRO|nr:hypothetical protein M9H77_28023 [Catharanthus roseus]
MPGRIGSTRPVHGTPLLAALRLELAAAPVARRRLHRSSSCCSSSAAGLFAALPVSLPLLLVGAAARPAPCASPLFASTTIAASAVESFFQAFLFLSFCSRFSVDSGDLRCIATGKEEERRPLFEGKKI